ncbi:hypothetical protein RGCCGE502_07279 [Rhizobium grahamii CCGE 502]|uniref:Uncharacterized protein n=2 Tax=Rhizobium grahamii TaxID=1120045 RepID=S3I250_9HYPH|nr:hypothetical protein RGCCGE502_07279 [Rhizobium grahamii CCGE 502]
MDGRPTTTFLVSTAPDGTRGFMLKSPVLPRDLPLFSDDLDLLSEVLDDVCKDRRLERNTSAAEAIGALLIQLYRQGVKDQRKLAALAKAYL